MKFILIIMTIFTLDVFAINTGFNQAWFNNDYGLQFMDKKFDKIEVERIFKLANQAGSKTVRLWFFESHYFPMIFFKDDTPIGIKEEFVQNVISTLEIANTHNIKIYFTLFDAHAYKPFNKSQRKLMKRFRKIFEADGGKKFVQNIISPLFTAINKKGLSHIIDKIDLVNEGDALIYNGGFKQRWKRVGHFICEWKNGVRSIQGFENTAVSMSTRIHTFLYLPSNFYSPNGPMRCADYYDLHSYNNEGKIERCGKIKKQSKLNNKPFILGEFGQSYFNHRYDEELQTYITKNYIQNAEKCGFSEILAWRLSDVRPGHNKEARYSFEAHGKMKPAYYIIQDSNGK